MDTNSTYLAKKLRKLESNISNLAWKVITTGVSFDEVFVDNLANTNYINGSLSQYVFDQANSLVKNSTGSNLTLVTTARTLPANNPTSSFCLIEVMPVSVGDIVENIDIQAFISINNGGTFVQYSRFYNLVAFQSVNLVYFRGDVSGLIQYNDNRAVFKIQTFNNKSVKIGAYSFGVRY